jgi:hypothetical protein
MELITVEPGAKRLIEGYKGLEYNLETAVADLIDNSIAAGSNKISIEIRLKSKTHPTNIIIADDGRGMNKKSLIEAMRYGSKKIYSENDLGKFGLGLKTASLSQTNILTVVTKNNKRAKELIARWDIQYVTEKDRWSLQMLDLKELELWERELIKLHLKKKGTLVIWRNPESLKYVNDDTDLKEPEQNLENHLSMVFCNFIKRKRSIFVNGITINPWDPFCSKERTKILKSLNIKCRDKDSKAYTIKVTPYILPSEREFSSKEAWDEASGPKKWNRQQGLYFFRNSRLLQAGGWSNCRGNLEEHQKLLRIKVQMPKQLDNEFGLNITKMRAIIPLEVKLQFEEQLSQWRQQAEKRYRKHHGTCFNKNTSKLIKIIKDKKFRIIEKNGKVHIGLPNLRLPKKIKKLLNLGKQNQLSAILYLFLDNWKILSTAIPNPERIKKKLFS